MVRNFPIGSSWSAVTFNSGTEIIDETCVRVHSTAELEITLIGRFVFPWLVQFPWRWSGSNSIQSVSRYYPPQEVFFMGGGKYLKTTVRELEIAAGRSLVIF